MRTRFLLISVVLTLALVPAQAHASTASLISDWHLDTQTSTPADDCGFHDPDQHPPPCVYWTTPDSSFGYDVGPYYHASMALGSGRWGQAISASNDQMPQRQYSDGIPHSQRLTLIAWVRHNGYPGSIQYIVGEGDDGAACSKASWALYTASSGVAFYITPVGQNPVLSPAM